MNDYCAYTTGRIVKIRDWRLGVLHWTFVLAIFCYIVIYSVALEQRYRLRALDIVGSTRLQLKSPNSTYFVLPANTSYCTNGTAPPPPNSWPYVQQFQFPCRYYDQYDAVDPVRGAM